MTDTPVIQILSGFVSASHRVNPSLGCDAAHASPAAHASLLSWWWLHGAGELVGNRGSDLAVPLSTPLSLLSQAVGRKGEHSLQTLLFSRHSSPQPFCSHSRMHPNAILPTLGSPLPSMQYTLPRRSSLPCCFCETQGFWNQPSHLCCLCITSRLTHPTTWAPSPTASATAQPSAIHAWQVLFQRALSPKALAVSSSFASRLSSTPQDRTSDTFKHTDAKTYLL